MHCICFDVSKDTMAIDGQSELPKGVRHQVKVCRSVRVTVNQLFEDQMR